MISALIIACLGQTYFELARIPTDGPNNRSVAFSPDGKFIAWIDFHSELKLWEMATSRVVATYPETNSIGGFAFASSGSRIAIGSYKSGLHVCGFDRSGFKEMVTREFEPVQGLHFSEVPEGVIAVSSTETTPIRGGFFTMTLNFDLVDSKTLKVTRRVLSDADLGTRLWLTPSGSRLAYMGSEHRLTIEDLDGKNKKIFALPEEAKPPEDNFLYIHTVGFSTDGKLIAAGAFDSTVRIWRIEDGKLLGTLRGHCLTVTSIVFMENNELIATGSWESKIKIWRTRDFQELQSIDNQTPSINAMSYSSKLGLLASVSSGKDVILWAPMRP